MLRTSTVRCSRLATLASALLLLLVLPRLAPVASAASAESPAERDARMAWWRDARFGMFIHWGLYAIPAGEWKGNKDHAEWIRHTAKIPIEEYDAFVGKFNPVKFDADEWVRLAKRAGMKYITITSKHHDGFCLWDSKQTEYDVMSAPFRRDILKELTEACKRGGVRMCFYHSIMDWHHPDYLPRRDWEQGKRSAEGADFNRFRAYLKGQLKELVAGYDPGVLWFDGEWENTWTHEMGTDLYDYVRGLNTSIIINNRVDKGRQGMQGLTKEGGFRGDFGTPEQEIPDKGLPGVDWESCMTMNDHWGWNQADKNWKSTEDLVRKLIDIASKGGNFLLNIGPKADGTFPAEAIERLEGIGAWMEKNAASIYGTQASPIGRPSWGRCTVRRLAGGGARLYLHVFDWPKDGRLAIAGLANEPSAASILAGGQALTFTSTGTGLTISLPAQAPDKIATVIALDLKDEPKIVTVNPYQDETPAERDARMRWWREARFGLFIHWGVYSVPAGTYKGKRIGGIGEWIMHNARIPVAEYKAFAKQFNPIKYDADAWVRLAKEAGMKYIVITSKHHDGFALFDSKATDWDVVDATPYGKDLLKPLAEACKKHGIKLGFYYSQAQDWNHPGGAAAGGHWDRAQDGSMDEYIRKIAAPQVREILTNYAPLAILWWDTPVDMTKERADALLPLIALQPGIIINNRLGGGYGGDSETPEQSIPATGYPGGRDWETCMTMNDTWGYKSYDNDWKSTETLIRNLVDIASKGGNYLLNVGPTSEGLIPEPSVVRLKEVGKWMKVNGEAIYGTTASPFKRLPWGRATKKVSGDGATLYLHVFAWPADGKLLVPGLKSKVKGASLLADPARAPLATQATPEGVVVSVPASAPDPISSTVVLDVAGALEVEPMLLGQAADGSVRLPAALAILHGDNLRYESGGNRDNIGFWTDSSEWVEWQFALKQPGSFTVTAEIAALGAGSFELSAGDQKIKATAPVTGDYGKFQTVTLGTIKLGAAGKTSIAVKPVKQGWHPINLKAIMLAPAK